jgi:hypothetical protein
MSTPPRKKSFVDKLFAVEKPPPQKNSVPYFNANPIPYSERVQQLNEIHQQIVDGEMLDLDRGNITKLCFQGIPDELRSFYWKIIIGFLPDEVYMWKEHYEEGRVLYKEFCDQFVPSCYTVGNENEHVLKREFLTQLRLKDKDDYTLFNEINKDVHRTFPHFHFFQVGYNEDEQDSVNPHSAALRRILYIWSKLNPGISYVQGMNEVVGPIYYLFATDSSGMEHAEADAFGCFTKLMGEIMNNFCKSLDSSEVGVAGQIAQLNNLLKEKDYDLWNDLEEKKIDPRFYTFRWLTLLLSQEFELPDVYRLWDSFFSDPNRFEYLTYVCCAMIINARVEILANDFGETMKLLQHYPPTNLEAILQLANDLYDENYGVKSALDGINDKVSTFLSNLPF